MKCRHLYLDPSRLQEFCEKNQIGEQIDSFEGAPDFPVVTSPSIPTTSTAGHLTTTSNTDMVTPVTSGITGINAKPSLNPNPKQMKQSST